ncbi:short chain dehydrogenase [Dactylonectria macrodidyma]|uniref:Short chain dehydrogenase n=1 Tax=Dactylonectria macrodidyma TaxID=307937 RepID=A0A9P9EB80_9HYPO|nr:short chain dehydrogenase [Dactylonectria macrodidyma]
MPTTFATYPSLRGQNVLITGGAEGIGAATVELFALQGSRVFFLDIADESARNTIQHVTSIFGKAHGRQEISFIQPLFYHCDVTDLDTLKATVDQIEQAHGVIHVLINNAAAAGSKARLDTEKVTAEEWDFHCNVNLRHVFFLTQAVLPAMKRVGGGSIVNMGSITWRIPAAGQPIYGACKAAIMGLTRIQSKEVGPWNIRINSVMPGAIATQRQRDEVLTPDYRAEVMRSQSLQRDLVPEDVAKVIVFLGSDEASGVTGSTYVVDGGWCSDP